MQERFDNKDLKFFSGYCVVGKTTVIQLINHILTCKSSQHQISSCTLLCRLASHGFQSVECVKVDKVRGAETFQYWHHSSVQSCPEENKKIIRNFSTNKTCGSAQHKYSYDRHDLTKLLASYSPGLQSAKCFFSAHTTDR